MKTAPLRPFETTWEDWMLGGGVAAAFEDPGLPLEVEIGPGDDDFLIENARAHPERNWLGIEYSRKRIRRYVQRVRRAALEGTNLRLAWRPAADVVRPFLVPARVQAYHVYFPDPWPKKHHRRYRLLNAEFLADLRDSLVPDGHVHVCTDDLEYARETLDAFEEVPGWHNELDAPGYRVLVPGEIDTVFEERWRDEGRTIHRLHLTRER